MIIYILLLVVNFGLYLLLSNDSRFYNGLNKKIYLILILTILLLLTTFRSVELGINDTEKIHIPLFNSVSQMNFKSVFDNYSMKNGLLFALVAKFLSIFTDNYRWFLLVSIIPFLVGIYSLIYNYSKNPFYSVTMLICLFYFISFTLMRQFFAIGFILISFNYLVKRKPVLYILFNTLAIMSHFSAIIFLPTYFLYNFVKRGKFNIILIIIMFIISFFLKDLVFKMIEIISPYYYFYLTVGVYSKNSDVSIVWLSILVAFLLIIYIFNKDNYNFLSYKFTSQIDKIFIYLMSMAIIIYSLSEVVGEFYRVSFYFSIFSIILVPNYFTKIKTSYIRNTAYISSTLLLVAYFFFVNLVNFNCLNYKFAL